MDRDWTLNWPHSETPLFSHLLLPLLVVLCATLLLEEGPGKWLPVVRYLGVEEEQVKDSITEMRKLRVERDEVTDFSEEGR